MPSKRRASTKKPTREVPAHEKAEALAAVVDKAVQTAEDYHETVNEFLASDESRADSRPKAA